MSDSRLRLDITLKVGVIHELIWERPQFLVVLHDLVKKSEGFNRVVKCCRYGPFTHMKLGGVIEHVVEGQKHVEDYTNTPYINSLIKAR